MARRAPLSDLESRGFIHVPGFASEKECEAMLELFMALCNKSNFAPVNSIRCEQITPSLLAKVNALHAAVLAETCVRADEEITCDFYYTHADCPTAGESKYGTGPFEGWHQVSCVIIA